jgi:hypothetical protein
VVSIKNALRKIIHRFNVVVESRELKSIFGCKRDNVNRRLEIIM